MLNLVPLLLYIQYKTTLAQVITSFIFSFGVSLENLTNLTSSTDCLIVPPDISSNSNTVVPFGIRYLPVPAPPIIVTSIFTLFLSEKFFYHFNIIVDDRPFFMCRRLSSCDIFIFSQWIFKITKTFVFCILPHSCFIKCRCTQVHSFILSFLIVWKHIFRLLVSSFCDWCVNPGNHIFISKLFIQKNSNQSF